jgi:serine/threonine protein kinase
MTSSPTGHRPNAISPVRGRIEPADLETVRPPAFSRSRRDAYAQTFEEIPGVLSSIPVPLESGASALSWDYIQRSPEVTQAVALKALLELLSALEAIHCDRTGGCEGRVSGVVCPSNALFTRDGKAQLPEDRRSVLPQPRAYVAPERESGRPIAQNADIYAVGVMMLEALSGRHLALEEVRVLEPCSIKNNLHWQKHIDDPLLAIALRATSKDARHRWASARELAEALARRAAGRVSRRRDLAQVVVASFDRHARSEAEATMASRLPSIPVVPEAVRISGMHIRVERDNGAELDDLEPCPWDSPSGPSLRWA